MSDVECLYHKGKWRMKALTDKARAAFLEVLDCPGGKIIDDADVFGYATDEQYDGFMAALRPYGLVITGGKPAWEL